MRGHIRKRGSLWAVVVEAGTDKNGRRKQQWHSGYRTRKDAQEKLTEILASMQTETYVKPSKQSLATYLRAWLDGQKTKLRPSTLRSYRMNMEVHVIPRLGSLSLQSVTSMALENLYSDLGAEGSEGGRGALSPRTVRYVHTILHKALDAAVRLNKLARNPAGRAEAPRPDAHNREMRTWTPSDLRRFFDQVKDDRYRAAWVMAATTGLRRGELLGLRWKDIDLDRSRLAITQTLLSVGGKLAVSTPKTAKSKRSVAIDAYTLGVLKAHRRSQLEERLAWGPEYEDNDLAFAHENGLPVHPDYFSRRWFNAHIKAAELPLIRFHDLRHTHATLALQAGVHPKVVSERLGHSTISITLDTYSHAIPALQEEAAEKIAAVVFG